MFRLEIETSNAAFVDAPSGEIARILRMLAERLVIDGSHAVPVAAGTLRDSNGNTVGVWQYTED